jgi:hypothetical protein
MISTKECVKWIKEKLNTALFYVKIVYVFFFIKKTTSFIMTQHYTIVQIKNGLKNERPTWCHLLFYFTYYVFNMFRTLIYPSLGACDCVVELPHRSFCSQFVVCWSFGAAGFEWSSFCRLKLCFSLVFRSSTITMMHDPINIRFKSYLFISSVNMKKTAEFKRWQPRRQFRAL